jgi:hypothetical protein
MLVLLTLFFILLQPGLIITATGISSGNYLASSQTSTLDVLIHSVVFFTINKMIATNTFGLGFFNDIEKEILGD